jgi:hypothetical protein
MQNQTENATSKLVSLFGSRKEANPDEKEVKAAESESSSKDEPSFSDAMKKNMENEERLRKERLKANQSVLKSYRIKN